MARWFKAKVACLMLGKHTNQIAVDYYNDKKQGWNRRIRKGDDGFLYANVDNYRSPCESNTLTKKRIEDLYYDLLEAIGEDGLISSLVKKLSHQTKNSIIQYFDAFSLKNRKTAIKYYIALRAIKQETKCQTAIMTPSFNAA